MYRRPARELTSTCPRSPQVKPLDIKNSHTGPRPELATHKMSTRRQPRTQTSPFGRAQGSPSHNPRRRSSSRPRHPLLDSQRICGVSSNHIECTRTERRYPGEPDPVHMPQPGGHRTPRATFRRPRTTRCRTQQSRGNFPARRRICIGVPRLRYQPDAGRTFPHTTGTVDHSDSDMRRPGTEQTHPSAGPETPTEKLRTWSIACDVRSRRGTRASSRTKR